MAKCSESPSIVQKYVILTILLVVHATGREICDKTKCPGPLRYYKELGCKPVYKNPNDCCATEYDCSHLKKLSKDKCYANDNVYSIGEALKPEDANACEIGCVCTSFDNVTARFMCAAVDCGLLGPQPNCFYRHLHDQCCPGPWVCLEEGEKRATCEVDGKTYQDGEYFKPKSDPDMDCYCMPGYKGENVEPFCKKPNRGYCTPLFRNAPDVHANCAPVFYNDQNPQKDCSYNSRCQNANDTVIHNHDSTKSVSEEDLSCQHTKQTVGAIYTRTNFVTLKYVTDSWGTNSNGFRLVITAVKDPKHTCKAFRCTQNEFCIETDLLCDGVNHCGDGSDEATSTLCANSEASTILGMQTVWFAVALVFLILCVAGLTTAGVLCLCRQRAATPRHPHNAHNAQSHPPVSFPLQQMYGSNGASAGLPVGMTTLKGTTGTHGALGNYGWAIGPGITGATTLPRPGNWLRPAGLRHGHSAARVRLYCQAK